MIDCTCTFTGDYSVKKKALHVQLTDFLQTLERKVFPKFGKLTDIKATKSFERRNYKFDLNKLKSNYSKIR